MLAMLAIGPSMALGQNVTAGALVSGEPTVASTDGAHTNGDWTPFRNVEDQEGDPGPFADVYTGNTDVTSLRSGWGDGTPGNTP
jgi:hypothetical protein